MATSLAPAPARAAYTPSTVAPLSAAAKAFRNPDFSLECRKPDKVALIPAPISQQQWSPPDEEKGRSIRSPGSRSNSTASLELGDRSLDSNGSATDVESLLDDDPFLDGWLEDRKASGVPGGASEGPFGPTAVERAAPWSELERPQAPRGVDWTRVLATAIETAKETLDLSGRGLYEVPASIWELSTMRKIPDPRFPTANPSVTREFQRTQSGPAFGNRTSKVKARTLARSSSGSLVYSSGEAVQTSVPLQLDLSKNHLIAASISHALFTLSNLKALFLRQNELHRLPEGVGRLSGLVELSLSGNQLEYLPAEILRLTNLAELRLHPNPFLPPPSPSSDVSPSLRTLGPLIIHFHVPSLAETCTRRLLTSDVDSTSFQPSIKSYELPLPPNFADHLRHPFQTTLFPPSATSGSSFSAVHPRRQRERTTSGGSSYLSSSTSSYNSAITAVERDEEPFDPLANICRSPAHPDEERPFYNHAVERVEWVSESCLTPGRARPGRQGARTIPIRHRGCGVRCLDWLEEPIPSLEIEEEE